MSRRQTPIQHEDKYEIPIQPKEAYRCFSVTGERRRGLRRGVAASGERRERELNDSESTECIYTLRI